MYAGITIGKRSGRIVGVHQRIDRVARRELGKIIPKNSYFPSTKDIIYFEGANGPDAIKHTNKSQDEPWYFIDPTKSDDRELVKIINNHIHNLSESLKNDNRVKAAFEASWLAHAVVDGMTPAHHYPLDTKIEELWGKSHRQRTSIKEKGLIKGINKRDTLSKNWQYFGAGGIMTAHIMFEMGVASAIVTEKFKNCGPNQNDIVILKKSGFEIIYIDVIKKIYALGMYDEFCKNGWTRSLASKTRKVLIPEIIRLVVLAWCQSLINSGYDL